METFIFGVVFLFGFILAIGLVAVIERHPDSAKMVFVIVAAVVVLLLAIVILPPLARAEETVVVELEDYVVLPVELDGELLLCIEFRYHENLLSFYWEKELDTSKVIYVEIWNNIECVDAGYVE